MPRATRRGDVPSSSCATCVAERRSERLSPRAASCSARARPAARRTRGGAAPRGPAWRGRVLRHADHLRGHHVAPALRPWTAIAIARSAGQLHAGDVMRQLRQVGRGPQAAALAQRRPRGLRVPLERHPLPVGLQRQARHAAQVPEGEVQLRRLGLPLRRLPPPLRRTRRGTRADAERHGRSQPRPSAASGGRPASPTAPRATTGRRRGGCSRTALSEASPRAATLARAGAARQRGAGESPG